MTKKINSGDFLEKNNNGCCFPCYIDLSNDLNNFRHKSNPLHMGNMVKHNVHLLCLYKIMVDYCMSFTLIIK